MNSHRFPLRMLTGAVMLALPVWAHAAGLGKLTVNSALGQPLSAEIELLVENKNELDSLKANLASSQAFKDAQIEYAPVLTALRFSVDKRADGRHVLKVTTSNAINDPFLDMLVELNWASGRLLREYTVLLDPPGVAVAQTVAPVAVAAPRVAPQATPQDRPVSKPVSKPVAKPASAPRPAPQPEQEQQSEIEQQAEKTQPTPAENAISSATDKPAIDKLVRVQRGDTLAGIAAGISTAEISLEEALVGLFRENPQAFVGNNMNRLKAGTTLRIPADTAMAAIGNQQASREVRLQAADWQAYRAKLAERIAAEPAPEPEKKTDKPVTTGKIASKVEDKAQPKAETKDVLKLSRGAAPATDNAVSSQAKQTDKTLAAKQAADKAAAAAKAAAEQEERLAKEKADKEAAERAAMLEKQIADMQKLVQMKDAAPANAGAQAPAPAAAPKVAAKPPVEDAKAGSWLDALKDNPLYWLGGLAVVVLGGALWWMMTASRRRKAVTASFDDSLLTGGDLSPSTVGAAASGGVVNTGDTSFLTDFSQAGLATVDAHDVDPIAEADVYMAYGRDAQAEEILREALSKTPERHEIRLKLLEIHAARKNLTAFESVAGELYAALGGQGGAIWDKATELGRSIDPTNALYGGTAAVAAVAAAATVAAAVVEAAPQAAVEPEPAKTEMAASAHPENVGGALDFELNFDSESTSEKPANIPVLQPESKDAGQGLDFDLSGLDIEVPGVPAAAAPSAGMDFSSLDLSLDDMGNAEELDEIGTKLDLARAYLDMGDKEGAREILQEVLNEGNENQKDAARSMMSGL